MNVANDFTQTVWVDTALQPWVKSPMPGVERKYLDRVGDEVARATSIVRYAPGSHFSSHVHRGGEEFIVLEGVFQDEHGDYPAGTYIRNPPCSTHTPRSDEGCIIFVKLWQFQPSDRQQVCLQLNEQTFTALPNHKGISVADVYADNYETVSVQTWLPYTSANIAIAGGAEVLVLQGQLQYKDALLPVHSWLRLPVGASLSAKAGEEGAKVWIKTGNLADVNKQIARLQQA